MKQLLSALLVLFSISAHAQIDTVKKLDEMIIKGYYNPQPLLRAISGVSVLDSSQAKNYNSTSLVSLINSAAGVKMEERSPGCLLYTSRCV